MHAPSFPGKTAWRWRPYHRVWAWLFLAWFLCYLDRSVTGPVVSWMIANDVGFLAEAPMQHALAGIIGSMFFAGYMLTQFPAGYLGDRYGHRTMVVISTAWAGVATLLSGLSRSLFGFVTMRVLTGLGEGAYYSNDRAIINSVTPKDKKGMAMGVVFVGLALGLTVATLITVPIIELAVPYLGPSSAWAVPFFVFAPPTMLVSYGLWRYLDDGTGQERSFRDAFVRLILVSAGFLVVIMLTFEGTLRLGWSGVEQALVILLTALALVTVVYWRFKVVSAPVLRSRDLWLMYLSAAPILYTLWFFGFWALLLVLRVGVAPCGGLRLVVRSGGPHRIPPRWHSGRPGLAGRIGQERMLHHPWSRGGGIGHGAGYRDRRR
jgi:MFS family permease